MEGWTNLIQETKDRLEKVNKPDGFKVGIVYEKYGTLRIDVSSENDDIEKILDDAERQSETICIKCGADGVLRTDREWLLVLCDRCNE